MMYRQIIGMVALIGISATWTVDATFSSAEAPHLQAGRDWLYDVQVSIHKAATNSPKWHSNRRVVQAHVHDINHLLDLAWKAARQANHKAADWHVQQAAALIERAARKEYLRHDDAAQILALIRRAWPESSI